MRTPWWLLIMSLTLCCFSSSASRVEGTCSWDKAVAEQLDPHGGRHFTVASVSAAFEKLSKVWGSLLITIRDGALGIRRSEAFNHKVHDRRERWVRSALLNVSASLPDTTFILSLQDCIPPKELVPELGDILFFASTWSSDRTALAFPITVNSYFGEIGDIDENIQYLKTCGTDSSWEQKRAPAFYRGTVRPDVPERERVFEAGDLFPDVVDAVENDRVSLCDQLSKHQHLLYVPGWCGWSGTLLPLMLSGGALFAVETGKRQFIQLELVPSQDYIPIEASSDAPEIARVVRRASAEPKEMRRVSENLRSKAARLLNLKCIGNYISRLVTTYTEHLV